MREGGSRAWAPHAELVTAGARKSPGGSWEARDAMRPAWVAFLQGLRQESSRRLSEFDSLLSRKMVTWERHPIPLAFGLAAAI